MSVRPNGLGAGRVGSGNERDEATAARHRAFVDLATHEGPGPTWSSRPVDSRSHLDERTLLVEAHRAATPPLDDDAMEPVTKWPLVVGTLVAAIALLVGFAELGSLPFR